MTAFRRVWRVTVGTLRVSGPMRVSFEIERTLRHTPNKATCSIWNLTRDHQAQIEQAADAQVVIEAGHEDASGLETLFSGELFRARGNAPPTIGTTQTGTDVVTRVAARDGGRAFQGARVSQSFGPNVSTSTVLRACAAALGVGAGNIDDVADLGTFPAGGDRYPEGTVLRGQAGHELTRVLASFGLRWSVQHGAIQIVAEGGSLRAQAVRLSPSTGLIGSPEVGTRGRVKAISLLTRDLWPGRVVLLESARVSGRFVARAVKYRVDSHANDFYADVDLAPEAAA
jgi:hypothetical protein